MGVRWAARVVGTLGCCLGSVLLAAADDLQCGATLLQAPARPSPLLTTHATKGGGVNQLHDAAPTLDFEVIQEDAEGPSGALMGERGKWEMKLLERNILIYDLTGEGVNRSDGQKQQKQQQQQQHTSSSSLLRRLQGGGAGRQTQATTVQSLGRLLMAVVAQELQECELVMAYDAAYNDPAILQDLLLLPNVRQVLEVRGADDLLRTVWASQGCRGYLLLFHDLRPLLTFAHTYRDYWDYNGRYLVVGATLPHLQQLVKTDKGRKTHYLTGEAGEWRLHVNQLYWGKGMMLPAATWRRTAFTSDADLFPDKVSDLRGAQLTVVTFVWEPSIMYQRAADGSLVTRYGVDIDAIALLAHAMNFTVRYVEPPEGELWGRQVADGSWDGIMGLLDRDEADIGVANMFLSYWRIQVVEFTVPYDHEESCFLARAEPPLPRWQALAFPFQWSTWVAILTGLLLSGPLLHLLAGWHSTWVPGPAATTVGQDDSCPAESQNPLCPLHLS